MSIARVLNSFFIIVTVIYKLISLNFILFMFQVTNGVTSQSKVKVKHLKPNQVHKMVTCKKPLAMFPKSTKINVNSSKKLSIKTVSNIKKNCIKEELLDDLDELNEDQISLLKDTEFLQTITMTENDIESKFSSDHLQEEPDICNSIKLHKSKDKL